MLSVHDLGVPHNLKLMALSGNEPAEVVIIGVEPGEIAWGLELTPGLASRLPEVVAVVLQEIGVA
jgi:hydrogenase maturation protease